MSLLWIKPQLHLDSPVATDVRPSLALFNDGSVPKLYVAWKGANGDERIWYSSFDGSWWANQQPMPSPVASSVGPSLAVFNGKLYAAWKGGDGDERIWYSAFNGSSWDAQKAIPSPVASSIGPSLAVFQGRLYAAWKGGDGDLRIWYSSFDGNSWANQQVIPSPVATDVRPSLATWNVGSSQKLYAAWKGSSGDERIWFSSFNGSAWAQQQSLPDPIASSMGPSLAVFQDRLYLAWIGGDGDERIWYTSTASGSRFGLGVGPVQSSLPGPIATSNIPALAAFGGQLYAVWKGGNNDKEIWYASAAW